MQKQARLVIGQIMQYRDKLYAKRHNVPKDMEATWNALMTETESLLPQINHKTQRKSISFKGSVAELNKLVKSLSQFNNAIAH